MLNKNHEMKKCNYISRVIAYCMLIVHFRLALVVKGFLLIGLLTAFYRINVKAAGNPIGDEDNTPLVYDEIPVRVIVEGYKNFYVDAIYTNNKLLFVNVEDLFRMLEISCVAGQKGNSLSGFVEQESKTYLIDYDAKQIVVGDRTINTKNRLVKESGLLYLEASLFDEAFGIQLNFNFRSLAIQLKSDFELPVIKQSRIEKMRSNLSKIKGETIADTVLKRNYHLFRAGTIDWLLASIQTSKTSTQNHFGLGFGTELLYGEACASINYYDQYKFDNRQLQYLWRWVDNDKTLIKQAQVGKISTQTISFLNAPIIGAVIRNTPTTIRKATGFYTINEVTEPNWTIELYINDILVDYTQADASGQFMFNVPIVYGYTTLKLKFYGTMGEERTEERTMNVPYTVMPAHEIEYSLASGMVEDSVRSRFGRGEVNYGVNRRLTIGGGVEYLSSIPNAPSIPFATATFQPFTKLTLNGEYAHGVKSCGMLNYYFRRDILLEIDYTRYVKGQLATRFNAPEERKVKLSLPFRFKNMNGFARFDYTQLVYKEFIYNQAYAVFSAYYKQFSANSATQFNWLDQKPAYITTDFALSYRLRSGFTLRSSSQYNLSNNRLMTYKAAIEKSIPKGNVSVSYERNVLVNDHLISLNFRYDLSFARTNISAIQNKGRVTVSESAMGSMAFGSGNKYIYKTNNSSVSKGGISLYPFLDMNQNGIFDADEHMVKINSVRTVGGKVIFSEKDSIVRITDLNAFTYYKVEFKDNDLDNIAWRFKMKTYQVLIDPNQFKRVDIPITPMGEVNGMVYLGKSNALKGLGRILIKFYDNSGKKVVAETLSESDGYIYFLGLEPGQYIARADSAQLSNLDLKTEPSELLFTLKSSEQGDVIKGLDFLLQPLHEKMPDNQELNPKCQIDLSLNMDSIPSLTTTQGELMIEEDGMPHSKEINTQQMPLPHLTEQVNVIKDTRNYTPGDTLYKVQLLALSSRIKVKDYFNQLIADVPGLVIEERLGDDGLYHYSTGAFRGKADAREFLRIIRESGWKDCFIATYAGGKRAVSAYRLKRNKPLDQADAKNIQSGLQQVEAAETEKESGNHYREIFSLDGYKVTRPDHFKELAERILLLKDTAAYKPGDTLFRVQLLALHSAIRVRGYFARLLSDVPGLTIEELEGKDGLYHYSTGAFSRLPEASEFLRLIKLSGWSDCFVAFYIKRKPDELVFRLKHVKNTNLSF